MSMAGLVITLSRHPSDAALARAEIGARARTTLGEAAGARLPIVVELDDIARCEELHRELETIRGVCHVDVVFIELEQASGQASTPTADVGAP